MAISVFNLLRRERTLNVVAEGARFISNPTTQSLSVTVSSGNILRSVPVAPVSGVRGPASFESARLHRRSLQQPGPFAGRRYYSTQAAPSAIGRILKADQVDLSKLKFSEVVNVNKKGGKYIRVSYDGPGVLRLQTPKMRAPFGIALNDTAPSAASDAQGQQPPRPPGISIQCSFEGLDKDRLDKDPDVRKFYELVQAIDDAVAKHAIANMKSWFSKEGPPEVIRYNLLPSIKPPKDSKYAPTIKFKVPMVNGEPTLQVYVTPPGAATGAPPELTDLESITPNSRLVSIVDFAGVWIAGAQYGTTWRVVQTKIEQTRSGYEPLLSYAIQDSE